MVSLDSVVEEIDRLSRRMAGDLERRDRRLVAPLDLTPSQAHTLEALEELGETAMNGLSDVMRVHGTTMTRMVDTLVERLLVERVSDPQDRRVVRVRLSPRGHEAVATLRRGKREMIVASLREMSSVELQSTMDGLRKASLMTERWGSTGHA